MAEYPKMLYRKGDMLPEHGRDYCVALSEEEEIAALDDGWGEFDPLDHDGKKGGSRKRRKSE